MYVVQYVLHTVQYSTTVQYVGKGVQYIQYCKAVKGVKGKGTVLYSTGVLVYWVLGTVGTVLYCMQVNANF